MDFLGFDSLSTSSNAFLQLPQRFPPHTSGKQGKTHRNKSPPKISYLLTAYKPIFASFLGSNTPNFSPPQIYAKQVDDALIASHAPNSVSSSPIHKAVALFRHAAHFVHSSAEKLAGDLPHSAAAVRVLNDRLMLTERAFLEGEGLRGRPWYKHLVRP
jgi:hypothetical protein